MVKVSYWTQLNKGALLGKFNATLENGLTIQCTLIQGRNGVFVDMPKKIVQQNGENKYYKTVFFENSDQDFKFKDETLEVLFQQEKLTYERPNRAPKQKSDDPNWEL